VSHLARVAVLAGPLAEVLARSSRTHDVVDGEKKVAIVEKVSRVVVVRTFPSKKQIIRRVEFRE
jgi:hypothetical protein